MTVARLYYSTLKSFVTSKCQSMCTFNIPSNYRRSSPRKSHISAPCLYWGIYVIVDPNSSSVTLVKFRLFC